MLSKYQNKIQVCFKNFPVHGNKNQFQFYNLYCQNSQNGIENSKPFCYPCVRQGCTTSCYFEGKDAIGEEIVKGCQDCGNTNQKIYLDKAFKSFVDQNVEYILAKKPLKVQIKPESGQFFFSFSQIKNDLISSFADYIGDRIIQQMDLQSILDKIKRSIDLIKLNQFLRSKINVQEWKQNIFLHNYCKYQPRQDEHKINYILIFMNCENTPLKVCILNEKSTQICSNEVFLEQVVINYMGQIKTFIFCLPTQKGTKYYFSCLNIHLNVEEQSLTLIQKNEWRQKFGRFGCNLTVDQNKKLFYVIGGFDINKQMPDHILLFSHLQWKFKDGQYSLEGIVRDKSKQKEKRFYQSKIGIKDVSCILNNENLSIIQHNNPQFLLGGGFVKDFSFAKSGYEKPSSSGINFLTYFSNIMKNSQMRHFQNEGEQIQFNLSNQKCILLELPFINKKICTERNRALLFTTEKKQKQQSKGIVYKFHTDFPSSSAFQGNTLNLNQLILKNNHNFSTLLSASNSSKFYIQTIFSLKKTKKITQRQYIHYLIVQFQPESEKLKFIPGIIVKK